MNDAKALICCVALAAGAASGPAVAHFAEADVTILRTFEAENAGDSFGFVAERLGDLDGDGVPELIIGAPANGAGGAAAGRAYVYAGATGEVLHVLTGEAHDQLGFAVDDAGDVDGDGVSDYLVGGPGSFFSTPPFGGRVILVSGASHEVIFDRRGEAAFAALGYEVSGLGDVDGDGVPDVIAGAPFASSGGLANNGAVVALSGVDGEELWRNEGIAESGFRGIGLSSVGLDLDEDGLDGVLATGIGEGLEQTGGGAVLAGRTGEPLRYVLPTEPTASSFGWFFSHDAGDVDGDGVTDLYVGDFGDTELGAGSGRAYVFSGAVFSTVRTEDPDAPAPVFDVAREISSVPPRSPSEGLGIGRGAGDLDGDGLADLVLGAYTNGDEAFQAGAVYLARGKDGAILRTLTGTRPGVQLGFDALMAGDVNGDGVDDVLVTGIDVAYVVAGTPLR
jgi:hypothetical protein